MKRSKYRLKASFIEAMQYTVENARALIEWTSGHTEDWTLYVPTYVNESVGYGKQGHVVTKRVYLECRLNSWVVKGPSGFTVWSDETFKERYELVD